MINVDEGVIALTSGDVFLGDNRLLLISALSWAKLLDIFGIR